MAQDWCVGSGVPSDPLSGGHEVPVEWQHIAWTTWSNKVFGYVYVSKRTRCRHCDQTRRTHLKNLRRNLTKARNTFNAHAKRYAKRWGCSRKEARRRLIAYGWDVNVIAEMFDAAERAGICRDCGWSYDFGEHQMTLDVCNPDELPLLASNTEVVCRSCNVRWQRMSWPQRQAYKAYVHVILNTAIPRQLPLGNFDL